MLQCLHVTSGNDLKLRKCCAKFNPRKYGFSKKVVNIWNSLPNWAVYANTTNMFKTRLDKVWKDKDIIYNFILAQPQQQNDKQGLLTKKLYHKVGWLINWDLMVLLNTNYIPQSI